MNKKLSNIMSGYFEENINEGRHKISGLSGDRSRLISETSVPIKPEKVDWKVNDDDCLERVFRFNQHEVYCDFILRLVTFELNFKHYADMHMNYPEVKIVLKTHDKARVTEFDVEYSRAATSIYDELTEEKV